MITTETIIARLKLTDRDAIGEMCKREFIAGRSVSDVLDYNLSNTILTRDEVEYEIINAFNDLQVFGEEEDV